MLVRARWGRGRCRSCARRGRRGGSAGSSLDGAPQTAGGLQRMKAAEAVDHAGEGHLRRAIDGIDHDVGLGVDGMALLDQPRSEEHTSELQSLMRISYAVFCLKKKKTSNRLYIKYTIDKA